MKYGMFISTHRTYSHTHTHTHTEDACCIQIVLYIRTSLHVLLKYMIHGGRWLCRMSAIENGRYDDSPLYKKMKKEGREEEREEERGGGRK